MSSTASAIIVATESGEAATNAAGTTTNTTTTTAKAKKSRANKLANKQAAAAAAAAARTEEPPNVTEHPQNHHDDETTTSTTDVNAVSVDLQTRLQISKCSSIHKHEEDTSKTATTPTLAGEATAEGTLALPNGHHSSDSIASAESPATITTRDATETATEPSSSADADQQQQSATETAAAPVASLTHDSITYVVYENELQMPDIMHLIQKDLSEPYSIYTYRYFIHNWPKLCFLAMHETRCVGAIVCKLDIHRQTIKRGYIAMLAVDQTYRKLKIGTNLVQNAIRVSCDR